MPVRKLQVADGRQWAVAAVYDRLLAQYGVDRGFGGGNIAASFDDNIPGTPAWQEKITGVPRHDVIEIAREFARTADKTRGRSMIIVGRSEERRLGKEGVSTGKYRWTAEP